MVKAEEKTPSSRNSLSLETGANWTAFSISRLEKFFSLYIDAYTSHQCDQNLDTSTLKLYNFIFLMVHILEGLKRKIQKSQQTSQSWSEGTMHEESIWKIIVIIVFYFT